MSKRPRRSCEMIQALEPRRLLTTFFGTDGPDSIAVQDNLDVYVNSINVGNAGPDDTIDAKGGNDTITILGCPTSPVLGLPTRLYVFGGAGNDTINIGMNAVDHDFEGALGGGTIYAFGDSGSDTLYVHTEAHDDDLFLTPTGDQTGRQPYELYADQSLQEDSTVVFGDDTESKVFDLSTGDDHVHANVMPSGTTINLGGGNNRIDYGAGGVLPTLGNATINGGVNTDSVVFDDSSGSSTQPNTYTITPTGVQNQTLTNFENITLNTRQASRHDSNTINVSGYPANSFGGIVINGGAADVNIGSPQVRVDFDSIGLLNFRLNMMYPVVHVYDQDSDASNNSWYLSTDDSPTRQWLHKGASAINWASGVFADIELDGGSTNDVFNIAATTPDANVSIDGGGGNDICQESNYIASNHIPNLNLGKLDAIFAGWIQFDGGAGDDQLILDDSADQTGDGDSDYNFVFDPYGIDSHFLEKGSSPSAGHAIVGYGGSTEQIKLAADADNNIITFYADFKQTLTLDGGSGNDLFVNDTLQPYSPTDLATSGSVIMTGGPGTDSLEIDDHFTASDVGSFDLTSTALTMDGTHFISYDATLENLTVNESDFNTTNVLHNKPAALRLTMNGDGGNDTFVMGGGDLDSNGWSNVTLTGGAGNDSIEFDDHADLFTTGETELAQFNGNELDKGAAAIDSVTFESQQLDASSAGNLVLGVVQGVNLNNTLIPTTVVAAGRCIINVGNPTTSNLSTITAPVRLTMNPSAGANINDQFSTGNKTYTLSTGNLTIAPVSGSPLVINFSGAGLTLNANTGNDTIKVLSSALAMPYIINGDDGSDAITIGNGNLNDLVSSVRVSGGNGTDSLAFDDSADPIGQIETLTDSSFAVGARTINFDTAESLRVAAGLAGDVINQRTDNSAPPITIGGGGGDDTFNVDLSGYTGATTGPSVSLSGDFGSSDALVLNDLSNSINTSPAISSSTYGQTNSPVFNYSTFESLTYNGGPANSNILVPSTAAGTPVTINAGAGNDSILIGGPIGNATLNNILGAVSINGEVGTDTVSFSDLANTVAQTFHVYPRSVTRSGMANVNFAAVETLAVNEGTGGDTAYVVPNATATISVNGNNPTTSPGDTLGLAFAAAQNPIFTAGATGAGGYTFANRAPVNYTGIEAKVIDSTAPTVLAASFNYNAPQPSVSVQFSEDVSLLLNAGALQLNNTTSNTMINPSSLQLSYSSATNTATFTFPTLPNHALPDGNYTATILASLVADTFGNQMANDFTFKFFSLAGDANHDRVVDVSDLGILATNWQGTGKTFNQGDFNYDGIVDVSDLGILATNWQKSLPAISAPAAMETPALALNMKARTERRFQDEPALIIA
jgi:hypothetical protein